MKKAISLFCVLCFLLASLSVSAFAVTPAAVGASEWNGTYPAADPAYAFEGEGTQENPWLIRSAADLAQLSANVRLDSKDTTYGGKFFRLTCDIDLKGHPWLGIGGAKFDTDSLGTGGTGLTYFAGNFDGDYHRIYNLNVATVGKTSGGVEKTLHQQGLFGYILGARITNLGIESGTADFVNSNRSGALVGVARCGFLIENCYNKANVTLTSDWKKIQVGGMIGHAADPWSNANNTESETEGVYREKTIRNCYNLGSLTVHLKQTATDNEFRLGGFVGNYVGDAPTLDGVWQLGDVTVVSESVVNTKDHYIGGVVGGFLDDASVQNTYFKGRFLVTLNGVTDLKKYKTGILFGRCSSKVAYDNADGNNVGYRLAEGSSAGYKGSDLGDTAWYGEMTDITLSLPAGSDFITAPELPIAFEGYQISGIYQATVDGKDVDLYDVRLLATVNSLEWFAAGFDVTVTVGGKTYRLPAGTVTTAYRSILETQDDGTVTTRTAPDGSWYIALTVTGIPAAEQPEFHVANYVCRASGEVARSTSGTHFTVNSAN